MASSTNLYREAALPHVQSPAVESSDLPCRRAVLQRVPKVIVYPIILSYLIDQSPAAPGTLRTVTASPLVQVCMLLV